MLDVLAKVVVIAAAGIGAIFWIIREVREDAIKRKRMEILEQSVAELTVSHDEFRVTLGDFEINLARFEGKLDILLRGSK